MINAYLCLSESNANFHPAPLSEKYFKISAEMLKVSQSSGFVFVCSACSGISKLRGNLHRFIVGGGGEKKKKIKVVRQNFARGAELNDA